MGCDANNRAAQNAMKAGRLLSVVVKEVEVEVGVEVGVPWSLLLDVLVFLVCSCLITGFFARSEPEVPSLVVDVRLAHNDNKDASVQ